MTQRHPSIADIKPIERNRFAVEEQRRRGQRRPPTVSTVFVWPERPRSGKTYTVRPEDFGLPRATIADLQGGDRGQNAEIIREILRGVPGPRRDIVVMNAAAALTAGGLSRDFKEGTTLARRAIDTGAALDRLNRLIELSQRLAQEK